MIYTSYFANIKNLPENVIPISIARHTPDWYKGLHYPTLAPSFELLCMWKANECNRDYYIKRFYDETLNRLNAYSVVMHLKHLCEVSLWGNVDICLVCYEKPENFCHRHLVRAWLNAGGFECREWGK